MAEALGDNKQLLEDIVDHVINVNFTTWCNIMKGVVTKKAIEAILEDRVVKKAIRSRRSSRKKKEKIFKDKASVKSLDELPRELRI